jgi:hypothetical protein
VWSPDVILPLVIFPALSALAYHYILGQLYESELGVKLESLCNPVHTNATPYLLQYTGFHGVDGHGLCPLVSFFHSALETPDASSFLAYFVGIGAPLVIIPNVEGWRNGRNLFVAFPMLFGLLGQSLTVGVTLPLYWLIFILTGAAKPKQNTKDAKGPIISQAHAEATIFGVIIGAIIPTVAMLILEDPYVTAIWQPYPIYVTIAQYIHLAIRPPSTHPESGYLTIRALYMGAFIICSSVHFSTLWPMIDDLSMLKTIFLPSLTAPDPSTSMGFRVHNVLKWDITFGFVSSVLATLWFAESGAQFFALAAWAVIGTPLVGPGAVVMGAALWRESHLQARATDKTKKN